MDIELFITEQCMNAGDISDAYFEAWHTWDVNLGMALGFFLPFGLECATAFDAC